MNRPLRVAAIGLGWVTLNRHLKAMRRTPEIDVVGVVDRRPGRAAAFAQANRIPRHHEGDDLSRIPWLDQVDAFSIGTHPAAHAGLARQALDLDCHAITEKPFAMQPEEGEELVTRARERGKTLAVVHNFQFSRSMLRLLADIRAGHYGRIRFIHAQQLGNPARRLPEWSEDLPLGLFYDESPHLFYLLRALAPPPLVFLRAEVHPSRCAKSTPAWISAHYAAGAESVPVKLNMAFEAPLSEWHVSVAGEHCFGDVDVFRDIYVKVPNDGAHTSWPVFRTSLVATWSHWVQHLRSGPGHLTGTLLYGNVEVFRRFAAAARVSAEPPLIGAEDGLAVLRMQHEIIQHAERLHGSSPSS